MGITVSGKVGNSVVRNRIKRQVRSAYAKWEASKRILDLLEQSYELSKKAYTLAHERYEGKMGTFTEFRDAESAYDRATQEKLKTEMNLGLALHELMILSASEIPKNSNMMISKKEEEKK